MVRQWLGQSLGNTPHPLVLLPSPVLPEDVDAVVVVVVVIVVEGVGVVLAAEVGCVAGVFSAAQLPSEIQENERLKVTEKFAIYFTFNV